MDRCRCDDYAAAVEKLRFYTVGTHRPDMIDNYKRGPFTAYFVSNRVNLTDLRVVKARALKVLPREQLPENILPKEIRKIEQMWCPYMTPYVLKN